MITAVLFLFFMSQLSPNVWDSVYGAPRQPAFMPSIEGPIELVTPAAGQVMHVDEIKQWCRIETTADDAVVAGLLERATRICEHEINGHRQFATATFDLPIAGWWFDVLKLPRPPLRAVTSVTYYDTAGVAQVLDATTYLARTPWRQPGTLERAPNKSWPSFQGDRRLPITIRFLAGYVTLITAVSTGADTITAAGWTFTDGDVVRLSNSGGRLPTPLASGTNYYVVNSSASTCKLAASAGGPAIDITEAGTGNHYLGELPGPIKQALLLSIADLYINREPKEILGDQARTSVQALLELEGWGSYA